jgi:hypothetical protein
MTPEQEELLSIWTKSKRHSRALKQFVTVLISKEEEFQTVKYIAAYNTSDDFVQILRNKAITGPHHSPYFRLRTDAELLIARMLINPMPLWDFRTGKKLNANKVQKVS